MEHGDAVTARFTLVAVEQFRQEHGRAEGQRDSLLRACAGGHVGVPGLQHDGRRSGEAGQKRACDHRPDMGDRRGHQHRALGAEQRLVPVAACLRQQRT